MNCKHCAQRIEPDAENGWIHSVDGVVGCGLPFHDAEVYAEPDGGMFQEVETPVFDRILEHYKDNIDGILTELNPNANFILVERNNGMSGGVFLTTHDSPEKATEYWTTQEDYWEIEKLVDLRTGEEYLSTLQIEWNRA